MKNCSVASESVHLLLTLLNFMYLFKIIELFWQLLQHIITHNDIEKTKNTNSE